MTIADSFKEAVNQVFIHTIFEKREQKFVLNTLSKKFHGSNNIQILPPIQGFKLEVVDDTHDNVTFDYDDYTIKGTITWKPYNYSYNGSDKAFVFMGIV